MSVFFTHRDPDTAYVTNNLLLPKARIPLTAIKNALEFVIGDEDVIDDLTGDVLGTIPKVLRMWDENEHHLIVPRNFVDPETYDSYPFSFVVERPDFETVHIESRAVPRNETQERAIQALLAHDSGTLNLACGKGKTVVSLMLAARLKVPTIVIVNSKNLIAQWREEVENHLNVSGVGIIQGKRMEWQRHPIVIATIQTLALRRDKLPKAFRDRFGLALFDEGHHMSAPKFVLGADLFRGRRYALTATAFRTDGLEAIYQYHLGKIVYRDLSQDLIPQTVFHVLDWHMPPGDRSRIRDVNGNVNAAKVQGYLGSKEWRNDIIAGLIRRDLREGREVIVLSHSKDHVYALAGRFGDNNAITGDIADENERLRILREENPVFGTFHLAREALNKKKLDTLYVATPFSNSNDLQQSWGRIQRELEGKGAPLVRVLEDKNIKLCANSCRKLRKFLRVLRYPAVREQVDLRRA